MPVERIRFNAVKPVSIKPAVSNDSIAKSAHIVIRQISG
jgi:hypothetical protein